MPCSLLRYFVYRKVRSAPFFLWRDRIYRKSAAARERSVIFCAVKNPAGRQVYSVAKRMVPPSAGHLLLSSSRPAGRYLSVLKPCFSHYPNRCLSSLGMTCKSCTVIQFFSFPLCQSMQSGAKILSALRRAVLLSFSGKMCASGSFPPFRRNAVSLHFAFRL